MTIINYSYNNISLLRTLVRNSYMHHLNEETSLIEWKQHLLDRISYIISPTINHKMHWLQRLHYIGLNCFLSRYDVIMATQLHFVISNNEVCPPDLLYNWEWIQSWQSSSRRWTQDEGESERCSGRQIVCQPRNGHCLMVQWEWLQCLSLCPQSPGKTK